MFRFFWLYLRHHLWQAHSWQNWGNVRGARDWLQSAVYKANTLQGLFAWNTVLQSLTLSLWFPWSFRCVSCRQTEESWVHFSDPSSVVTLSVVTGHFFFSWWLIIRKSASKPNMHWKWQHCSSTFHYQDPHTTFYWPLVTTSPGPSLGRASSKVKTRRNTNEGTSFIATRFIRPS